MSGVEAEVSAEDLTGGGVEVSGDTDTPEGDPPSPEIDLSKIEIDGFNGSQPDGEEVKSNADYAAERIEKKKLKKERLEADLRQVETQPAPYDTEKPAPRRVDYLNDDTLAEKYEGNVDVARAAYEDARDDWDRSQRTITTDSVNQKRSELAEHERVSEVHENFDKSSEKYVGKVKNLGSHIRAGEKSLAFQDAKGQVPPQRARALER